MKTKYSREDILRIAAEKVRRKEEEEKRANDEYYLKITTGKHWNFFKVVVAFCTLMMVLTTIEIFVDGETKKLDKSEWKIDREMYILFHQSIKVGDYLFVPHLRDWSNYVEGSYEITYSPIFRTGKKLSYDLQVNETTVRRHETIRRRSIFTWFPFLQILMLIPLATFIFKRQKPWFTFTRIASLIIVLPGIILVTILTLL
ncbi:MAG: hypothetical protein ACJASQ_002354 [Crocinitomicaceae bacterium]|jgi:hypothetical protein